MDADHREKEQSAMNEMQMQFLAGDRRRQLLAEAEAARLARHASAARPLRVRPQRSGDAEPRRGRALGWLLTRRSA